MSVIKSRLGEADRGDPVGLRVTLLGEAKRWRVAATHLNRWREANHGAPIGLARLTLLAAHWDLQVGRAVLFRVEAAAVDVSRSPVEKVAVEVHQVVFLEVASSGQAEGG